MRGHSYKVSAARPHHVGASELGRIGCSLMRVPVRSLTQGEESSRHYRGSGVGEGIEGEMPPCTGR
jgi:hypothetical protein